jgi:hypothetical protein
VSDAKFVTNIPAGVGSIVGMCVHLEKIYVAAQFGVFVLKDGKLEQLLFVPHDGPPPKT